jgi:hypothetical protein
MKLKNELGEGKRVLNTMNIIEMTPSWLFSMLNTNAFMHSHLLHCPLLTLIKQCSHVHMKPNYTTHLHISMT